MIPVAAHIELDLSALQHNVRRVREYAPKSQPMAVIKANAYGHGLVRVASHLEGEVDAFAVARLDEAIRLREANIQGRILVLQGFSQANEVAVLLSYQLEVVIHSEEQVAILESLGKQGSLRGEDLIIPESMTQDFGFTGVSGKQAHSRLRNCFSGVAVESKDKSGSGIIEFSSLRVWLKIDTGMNRLGIQASQFESILLRLQTCKLVHQSINFMTHFANADDSQDDKTRQQLQLFQATVNRYSGEKSSANSAGLIAWPASRQDWVRPGLMLYGVSPLLAKTATELNLLPVMNLYSRIIAIKQVKKGQAVGYSGSWLAEQDTLIAVVSIGYGDGYPRHAKQGTPAIINSQRVPLIGRVSMDMLTLDLSGTNNIKLGDKVRLWGESLPVEEIAACAATIPYTLLCGITQRVQVCEKG